MVTFQFWWQFRFGGTSVIGEFQLFRCHLSFCDIWVMVTLKFQRHFSFGDISPIPTRKSADLNISSHGVHPPTTTTKNTRNIEPLQVFCGLVGIEKSGDQQWESWPLDWRPKILKCGSNNCQYIVVLQSKWQGPKYCWKYGTNLSHKLPTFYELVFLIEEQQYMECGFNNYPTMMSYLVWLVNSQNYVLMYCCSQIQGTMLYFFKMYCLYFLKCKQIFRKLHVLRKKIFFSSAIRRKGENSFILNCNVHSKV